MAEDRNNQLHCYMQDIQSTKDVEGDGNCLYRAIAFALYQDENRYQEIKKGAVKELKEMDFVPEPENNEEYKKELTKSAWVYSKMIEMGLINEEIGLINIDDSIRSEIEQEFDTPTPEELRKDISKLLKKEWVNNKMQEMQLNENDPIRREIEQEFDNLSLPIEQIIKEIPESKKLAIKKQAVIAYYEGDNTWGDEIMITAISQNFKLNVHVLDQRPGFNPNLYIYPDPPNTANQSVHIQRINNNHYQALTMKPKQQSIAQKMLFFTQGQAPYSEKNPLEEEEKEDLTSKMSDLINQTAQMIIEFNTYIKKINEHSNKLNKDNLPPSQVTNSPTFPKSVEEWHKNMKEHFPNSLSDKQLDYECNKWKTEFVDQFTQARAFYKHLEVDKENQYQNQNNSHRLRLK